MCATQVKGVTAMDVVVKGLLYQVLGLVTCQLCYPARDTSSKFKWVRGQERRPGEEGTG